MTGKGHDPVAGVVANVGAAAEFDTGARAPIDDNRLLVGAEFDIVRKHVVHPAEPQPGHAPHVG